MSLYSPFRIGTTHAVFHALGKRASFMLVFTRSNSLDDKLGQSTLIIFPAIPSDPGALLGEMDHTNVFRFSNLMGRRHNLCSLPERAQASAGR